MRLAPSASPANGCDLWVQRRGLVFLRSSLYRRIAGRFREPIAPAGERQRLRRRFQQQAHLGSKIRAFSDLTLRFSVQTRKKQADTTGLVLRCRSAEQVVKELLHSRLER